MIIKDNKDEEDKQWNLEVGSLSNSDELQDICDFISFWSPDFFDHLIIAQKLGLVRNGFC